MFITPKKILEGLKLDNNLIAADFGCGSGGFSIPLAKILRKGKVYAIDVQKTALSSLVSNNIPNIKAIHCDLEKGSTIRDNEVDIVILANILHQVEDIEVILKEASRVLKDNGILLIVDWNDYIDKKEVLKKAESFKLKEDIDTKTDHFVLVFNK